MHNLVLFWRTTRCPYADLTHEQMLKAVPCDFVDNGDERAVGNNWAHFLYAKSCVSKHRGEKRWSKPAKVSAIHDARVF